METARTFNTSTANGSRSIALVGLDGCIEACNNVMAGFVDKPLTDLRGRVCGDLLGCPFCGTHECLFAKAKQSKSTETSLRCINDRWVEESVEPMVDEQGNMVRAILSFSQATDPTNAMNNLLRMQRLEPLVMVTRGIAHDLNNLFTILEGHTSLLSNILPEGQYETDSMASINVALSRGKELSGQLFKLGTDEVNSRTEIPLDNILRDSARFALIGSHLQINTTMPEDLWHIYADPDQMKQLVSNIVINARHAIGSDAGCIEIVASNVRAQEAEDLKLRPICYVRITISNNGPVIDKKLLGKIFQPYFTTRKDGTGLGLAVTSFIVKQHKGYISAESEPGRTAFTIYLPVDAE